jgi:hypothetical protein
VGLLETGISQNVDTDSQNQFDPRCPAADPQSAAPAAAECYGRAVWIAANGIWPAILQAFDFERSSPTIDRHRRLLTKHQASNRRLGS